MQLKKLLRTAVILLAGTCVLASCSQPTTPNTNPTPEEKPQVDDQSTLDNVKKSLALPEKVAQGIPELLLIKEKNGVQITWESSNNNAITNEGAITFAENDVTVTLTATLKKGEKSATKSFKVTVLGTKTEVSNNDVLDIVINNLPKDLPFDNSRFSFKTKKNDRMIINNKTVSVVTKNLTTNDNIVEDENFITISRDLVDYSVELEFTLSLDESTSKKVTRTFLIPKITEVVYENEEAKQKLLIENDVITMVTEYIQGGKVYSTGYKVKYNITDPKKKLVTAEMTHFIQNGKEYTIQDFCNIQKKSTDAEIKLLKAIDANKTYESLYNAISEYVKTTFTLTEGKEPDAATLKKQTEEKIIERLQRYVQLSETPTLEAIKAEIEKEGSTVLQNYIDSQKNMYIANNNGLKIDSTWDDILVAEHKKTDKQINSQEAFLFQYGVNERAQFYISTVYDTSKPWYKQQGDIDAIDFEKSKINYYKDDSYVSFNVEFNENYTTFKVLLTNGALNADKYINKTGTISFDDSTKIVKFVIEDLTIESKYSDYDIFPMM